ncbi:breast cancer type 1 susceptibility protein homolog isoform X1 [Gymnodraco acuticeps]|uniref:RING-type E3 ubiquitin transferase BRCA1 n=1 Tax=Gymnodraco acuticeps TaxID=8218 RepID=A0A6P8U0D2_GYMAC|nr:breast cancer type 1 susceptibility protein homolog isoform X1 [Gymnodraco acuticeps]
METPLAPDVKKGISGLWETLQCPICLQLMTAPVSTKCDHQFCKCCMMKLLDNTIPSRASCPVCKTKITRRSLQESPGFQRLISGLQSMIQAYENDTGINYFTGMCQEKGKPGVLAAEATKHCHDNPFEETPDNEENVDNDDLSRSPSSTIAAQNGFARLMGLEDTSPLTTENEGLDSGLGEAPPMSDKKTHSPPDNVEAIETEISGVVEKPTSRHKTRGKIKAFFQPPLITDETKYQPLRKSLRKKQNTDLDPDKILEEKQKISLEKVAEWLMKVPTEGSLELEKPNKNSDDSESCSSSSTINVKQHNIFMNPTSKGRAKILNEQVFGAVYKRDRKGIKNSSPALHVKPQTTKETQKNSKINKRNTFADIVKKTSTEDKHGSDLEEEQQRVDQVIDTSSDIFEEAEKMDVMLENDTDKHGEEFDSLPESKKQHGKDEVPCPKPLQPKRKLKKRTHSSLQQVDIDFQKQAEEHSESTEQKKTDKKKGKNTRSENGKSARVPKPLVLVAVQNGETSPMAKPRSEEVQLHIENYPSSEEKEIPVTRSNRRSIRLQLFAEEVQEGHKKANWRANKAEKESIIAKQSEEAKDGELDDMPSPKNESMTKVAEQNGCIYGDDLGGIENMESGERPTPNAPDSIVEVPNTDTWSEASSACNVAVVPSSTSPHEDTVVPPTLERHNPANHLPNNTRLETLTSQTKCAGAENKDDNNDSELDTEQLLKSFKATKRKSFNLGGSNVKRTRGFGQENVQVSEEKDSKRVGSGVESVNNQMYTKESEMTNQEALRDNETSSCCDFISPSISPSRTRKPVEKADQVVVEASIPDSGCSGQDSSFSRNNVSSALTPNKVSKRKIESPNLSAVPRVVDSGLRYTAAEHDELNEPSKYSQITEKQLDAGKGMEIRDVCNANAGGTHSVNTAEHFVNTEFSLTPSGLSAPVVQIRDSCGSGELSAHSSLKRKPKKRKKFQRLESSSESDHREEELPTLTEIFGTSASRSAVTKDQGDSGEARCEGVTVPGAQQVSRPPASHSPDCVPTSQCSVDLFGTPDECDVPVNDVGTSQFESSQFSSEVLVTQQKIEMQNELVRLKELMALVTKVLQEKEDSPAKEDPSKTDQSSKTTGQDTNRSPLCNKDTGPGSDQEAVQEVEREPSTRPSDGEGVAEPGVSETDVQRSTHTGPGAKGSGDSKTPSSSPAARPLKSNGSPSDGQEDKENNTPPKDRSKAKMVLASSGLAPKEQTMVKKFAKRLGGRVVSQVTPEVTHVIMHTDEQLVCERTLKYFLGIAARKWVVSFQWISECFKLKKVLDESAFEVGGDVVNGPDHQGPMRARTTEDSSLLMKGFRFCFQGSFTDMTTDELEWMVELCGAAVVKDPLLLDSKQQKSRQLVIVQPGSESSSSTYSSLSKQATVVTRGWLLDTVATYTLQNYNKYKT